MLRALGEDRLAVVAFSGSFPPLSRVQQCSGRTACLHAPSFSTLSRCPKSIGVEISENHVNLGVKRRFTTGCRRGFVVLPLGLRRNIDVTPWRHADFDLFYAAGRGSHRLGINGMPDSRKHRGRWR
jgi:hypothetical protein